MISVITLKAGIIVVFLVTVHRSSERKTRSVHRLSKDYVTGAKNVYAGGYTRYFLIVKSCFSCFQYRFLTLATSWAVTYSAVVSRVSVICHSTGCYWLAATQAILFSVPRQRLPRKQPLDVVPSYTVKFCPVTEQTRFLLQLFGLKDIPKIVCHKKWMRSQIAMWYIWKKIRCHKEIFSYYSEWTCDFIHQVKDKYV